jgi:O-succinylbenzoate synthase
MADVKIADFKIYAFTLPLKHPLRIGNQALTKRSGFLVALKSDDGHATLGETAPLPGLSHETLDQAQEQLRYLQERTLQLEIPGNLGTPEKSFKNWLQEYHVAPSVQFGFESAVLGLLAAKAHVPLFHFHNPSPRNEVMINALLSGSMESVIEKTKKCLQEGFRGFKLKVGRSDVTADVRTVRTLKKELPRGAVLRLDANRAWTIDQASTFFQELSGVGFDYIEEPVKSLALLKSWLKSDWGHLPVAIDESLIEIEPEDLQHFSPVKAIILKPSLLGAERTFLFAAAAKAHGMVPVISAAFETSVGVGVLARMAAAIHSKGVPAGLDTLEWLEYDLLETPVKVENGTVRIPALPDPTKTIRKELLTPYAHA